MTRMAGRPNYHPQQQELLAVLEGKELLHHQQELQAVLELQ